MGNTSSSVTNGSGLFGIQKSVKGGRSRPITENIPDGSISDSPQVGNIEMEEESFDGLRKVTVLIIGLGQRGQVYATYAKDFPERMKVGIAEPIQRRRDLIKNTYKVDSEYVFTDWKEVRS